MHAHIAETELARFAADPDSVSRDRRAAIEAAAAECATCRGSIDFFSVIGDDDLSDPATWDAQTEWSSENPMRIYAERIAEEDRAADELLKETKLLDSPTKLAWRNLQRDRRFLNGGVVRRLNAHANGLYENEPLDALTFADAAISVAETLPDDAYPWNAAFELRGTAWKERANALMVLGDFPAALEALKHAERAYRRLTSPGFGLATVALVRASVRYIQEHFDEAAALAEQAERGFAHLGQEERRTRAVFLRGNIKYESGQIGEALALFTQVREHGENTENQRWIGQASTAIGNCELSRRNLAEAAMHFHEALVIFREIGPEWDRLAAEWGLGSVVLHGGNPQEAIRRMRSVAAEFEKRSMVWYAALVWLDVVEAWLALGQMNEITAIASRLFEVFKNAGMMTSALTAIAFMKEAAARGRLSKHGVNTVRTYLRRAGRQPELLFEPPPEFSR